MSETPSFEAFFSYNSADRLIVETIARKLKERGVNIFFDKWYLIPGTSWPDRLEEVINSCKSVVVFVGSSGIGNWQQREQQLALSKQSLSPVFRVIPVLLDGVDPPLSFLFLNTWIDLRKGVLEEMAISNLIDGIRGSTSNGNTSKLLGSAQDLNPYRGLKYFREEDSIFFFGREVFASRLKNAVTNHNFVAVVGTSGSGKSSVVRAGLLPELRKGNKDENWEIIIMTPGEGPLRNLSASLLPLIEPDMTEVNRLLEISNLARGLSEKSIRLVDVLKRIFEKQPGTNRILLFIDQWEELYSKIIVITEKEEFIEALLDALSINAITIILTLRGDFYNKVLENRRLSDHIQDGIINISHLNSGEIREVIESPARTLGVQFEVGLTNRIIEKVKEEPESLPLLEFLLSELWSKRSESFITHILYEQIGEVDGSIASYADGIFNGLQLQEQKIAKRIFLKLIHPGLSMPESRYEPTKRRASYSEFRPEDISVITKLADAHLLVLGFDEGSGNQAVDLVHEALISAWDRLRQWVGQDRPFLNWREHLRALILISKVNQNSPESLLTGKMLADSKTWLKQRIYDLSLSEQEFIEGASKYSNHSFNSLVAIVFAVAAFATPIFLFLDRNFRKTTIDAADNTRPMIHPRHAAGDKPWLSKGLDTVWYDEVLKKLSNGDKTGRWPAKAPYPLPGAILPFYRVIAFYGNLYSKNMGVLGELPKEVMLQKLIYEQTVWESADPTIPVLPALSYIVITAQSVPGMDGKYRARMPFSQIDTIVNWANEINGIVVLETQIGFSTLNIEVPTLENFLKQPMVHLAIDPEFSMKNGAKPGTIIGSLNADDINWVVDYLSNLVKVNHLPPKMLVIHRFTKNMLQNLDKIKKVPEVQIVIDMDGWGVAPIKEDAYKAYIAEDPVQFTGYKVFNRNDYRSSKIDYHDDMYLPQEILSFTPQPIYISYQ